MPDAPRKFRPGDVVRMICKGCPGDTEAIAIVCHEDERPFGHGMIPVLWIRPPWEQPLNYPKHRLELVSRLD